jgi:hypothetical protein
MKIHKSLPTSRLKKLELLNGAAAQELVKIRPSFSARRALHFSSCAEQAKQRKPRRATLRNFFLAGEGRGVDGLMVEEVARYLPGRRICTRVVAGALVLLSLDGHWPQPVAQALSTSLPPARNERKRRQPCRPT